MVSLVRARLGALRFVAPGGVLCSTCAVLLAATVLAVGACSSDDPPGGSSGGNDGGLPGEDGSLVDSPGEPTQGCGTANAPTGALSAQQVSVGASSSRTFELFVPDGHDGKRTFPLVFVFHGDGGTGKNLRSSFKLEAAANGGAIFVYPDGANRTWDVDSKAAANADIKFFDAMVAELSKTYCVDTKKIFATGFSRGAYFANQLGCRRGSVLRGVAAHSGGGPYGANDEYDGNGNLVCPEAPVAAIILHGTADNNVAPSEADDSLKEWRRFDTCKTTNQPYAPSPCVAFDGCAAGRPVVSCRISGLGHQIWPSAPEAIWKFFSAL